MHVLPLTSEENTSLEPLEVEPDLAEDADESEEEPLYEMTKIRKPPRASNTWKYASVALLLLVAFLVAMLVSDSPFGSHSPKANSLRSPSGGQDVVEKIPPGTLSEGERLFRFEVGSLDGEVGNSGSVVIRTRPSWAPLGVKQFHVRHNAVF